jgi:hypothetical protein
MIVLELILLLIVVNVQLEEVREVKVNYSFEEVAAPEDAKTVDGGNVQPKEVSQSGLSKLAEKGADLFSKGKGLVSTGQSIAGAIGV